MKQIGVPCGLKNRQVSPIMSITFQDIQTDRLQLRKLELSDVGAIYDIFSNEEDTRFWSSPQMTERSEAESFIKRTHQGSGDGSLLEWGVVNKADERLIGTCAFSGWDKAHKHAEIGFALHRGYWGNGYMKEALGVFIPFGFEQFSFHRIEADADPRNIASITLLEHFGFKREGYLRERYHQNGEIQDAVIYGLLRSENVA